MFLAAALAASLRVLAETLLFVLATFLAKSRADLYAGFALFFAALNAAEAGVDHCPVARPLAI